MSAGSFWRSPSIGTTTSPRGRVEAGRHRGRLPEVAAEADQPQPGTGGRGRLEPAEAVVARSVVDDQHLGAVPRPFQLGDDVVERGHEPRNRLLLLEAGDDDRDLKGALDTAHL